MTLSSPIILFDGVCNLCSSAVQFVIKHDSQGIFKFASLQSDFGQHILQEKGLSTGNFDSFILIEKNKTYLKSAAALRVNKLLGGIIALSYVFIIIPKPIRDGIYSLVAKNRYKWFGKKEACWIPTPELQKRFL